MFKGCVRKTEILFEENTESVYRVVLGQDGSMIQTDELFACNIEEMMPHLLIPIGKIDVLMSLQKGIKKQLTSMLFIGY